ncbi:MAG: hypothetical protein IJ221_06810, partial [Oscillibacter sp.]|nr:hypothetical protein [Oscillibacter sp.]
MLKGASYEAINFFDSIDFLITSISPFTFALRLSTEDIDPVFSAVANAEPLTLQEGRLASSDVKSIQSAV